MKRIILVLSISLTFISSAWAEWEVVNINASGTTYAHLSKTTVQKINKSTVRFWGMLDLKNPEAIGTKSYVVFQEVDCLNKRIRTLDFSAFSGSMGQGLRISNINKPSDWIFATPTSAISYTIEAGCWFAARWLK